MPLRTDALAPGLTAKGQPLQLSDSPPTHPSLSCDERSKPPVSRSGSAGGEQRVGSGTKNPPSATSAGPPAPNHAPPLLAEPVFHNPRPAPSPHMQTHTHTKGGEKKTKKLPWGLPPAVHQGEFIKTASPTGLHRRNPKHEHILFKFYFSYFIVILFFFLFVT